VAHNKAAVAKAGAESEDDDGSEKDSESVNQLHFDEHSLYII